MKTRNGKIARLPLEIRDQLNTRLADGEPGNRLVEWLNLNPAVTKVMDEQFEGRPITEHNISEWRAGGFEEWLTLRSFLDETRILSENAGEVVDTGLTSDHLRLVLLAYHAHLLQNWEIMPQPEFKHRVDALKKLTTSVMTVQRAELQKVRLQLQRERLELLREKQSLRSAEAIGRGAGGGLGKSRASKATTSPNSRPDVTEAPGYSGLSGLRSPLSGLESPIQSDPLGSALDNPNSQVSPGTAGLHSVSSDSVRSTPIHPTRLAA